MADDLGEEFWSDYGDYSLMTEPVREKDKPTTYKSDEQWEQEAQGMIHQHRASLVGDHGRITRAFWTIILCLIPLVLLCVVVRVIDAIGLFDKITATWNAIPK